MYGDGFLRPNPAAAARLLERRPDLIGTDPLLACATGDVPRVRAATDRDASWVNRPGGPLNMPPLVAVTHSGLARLAGWSARLLRCTELLLGAGADPNQSWVDPAFPAHPLSALYGAAGKLHHDAMTRALLDAGATPNDGESLYHAVEKRRSRPAPGCCSTRARRSRAPTRCSARWTSRRSRRSRCCCPAAPTPTHA